MAINLEKITGEQYLSMTDEEQLRVMTEIYRELYFKDIQSWSLYSVDVLEELGTNDYDSGHSRLEIPLGFLRSCSKILEQAFTNQSRHELQVMTEATEFGAELSNAIYDQAVEIGKLVEDMITYQTYYHATLQHRADHRVHLLNQDGDTQPYSAEEIKRIELIDTQDKNAWRESLRQQRKELSDAYWGRAPMPELHEEQTHCQCVLPLWEAGFAVV